jgi:2-amino-4-hydroxy-6-hydroxymethyldihydropteridine diphosphokinase
MSSTIRAYIGLGSNLENPRRQVELALTEISEIPQTRLLKSSRWYQSKAVGPGQQPDYVNGVALIETGLEPHQLLDQLQAIEEAHERVRKIRWGPRTLDLDLLLFGAECIDTPRLTVPHAYLTQRNFVLYPLADITEDLVLPSGEVLESLLANCSSEGLFPIQD